MLHELLHIFVRAVANIRRDTIELRLQFRGKMHFHDFRVGKAGTPVK